MTRRADDPSSHPDPELGAAWSRVSRDEPPAALDDSIRAAARRAVHAAPHAPPPSPRAPAASRGWWPVAAAATLAAVVVGIVQMAPDERRHDELAGRMQGEPTVRPQAPSVPGAPVLPERAPSPAGPQASPPSGPPSTPPSPRSPAASPSQSSPPSSPQSSPLPPQLPPPLPDQPVVPKTAAPRAEATAPPALARPFPAAPAAAPSPTAAPDARARDSQDARTVGSTSPAAGASSVHGETKPLPTPPVAADTLRGHARRDGAAPRSMAPPTLESRQAPAPLGTSRPGQAAAAVGMGPSAGPSAAGSSAGSAAKSTAEAPAFADWVAAIEALVRGQRDAEARRELTRLRARYPERLDDLPPALRALLPPG